MLQAFLSLEVCKGEKRGRTSANLAKPKVSVESNFQAPSCGRCEEKGGGPVSMTNGSEKQENNHSLKVRKESELEGKESNI